MALNRTRNWLVAYDIGEPRRLRRVHRLLSSRAVPVQYSVFATRATAMQIGRLRAELSSLVHRSGDDVRIYPVPEPADLAVLGRKALPEGITILAGETGLRLAPFAPSAADGTIECAVLPCDDGRRDS